MKNTNKTTGTYLSILHHCYQYLGHGIASDWGISIYLILPIILLMLNR